MRLLAKREIYRLDIKVGVSGDGEAKAKLTATEKMAEQAKRKVQALGKLRATPSARFKDNASRTIDKINSKTKNLSRAISTPTARLNDQATSKLNKISTTIKKLDNTNVTANLKINDQTSTYLNKVHAKTNKLKDTNINPTAKIADEASSKLDKLNSKVTQFKSARMSPTAKIKDEASNAADKIQKKTDKLSSLNPKIKVKAEDQASKTLTNIQNKVNGWIKTGAKKIISLAVVGSLALGGLGVGSAIKTFSSYEQGLSNVKAVTEATDTQMKQLGDTAKSLGASTAWSAVQVTQAEELLGQAGFSVKETITALPGLLSLASAGGLDLAAATDIASGTLRAFSLNANQSGHVADVLALSASATNSDVTDLGETMKYVAPVSASLGISLEDTAAAAGLLSNQNIKGSQAGTVLRQAMARLASPTKEAATAMEKYGINAFDAQGNMKPLSGVVDNLNSSLSKLTSQQRADVISTVFGTESMSGIFALMNQGGESLSSLSKRLKETKGAADKMAETKLDNLAGQWEQLKGAAETMQINIGEKLAPYTKQFVIGLTEKMPAIENKIVSFVDYISKHTEDIKLLGKTVLGLGVAFAGLNAVGNIGNSFVGIKNLVDVLKGAKVAKETSNIAGGLKNIGLMGKILPSLLSPAGVAIATTAVTAGVAIAGYKSLMNKTVTTTTEELRPIEKIMNGLTGNVIKSKKEMVDLGLIYDDFGNGVSDNFKKAAQEASKSLLKIEMDINRLTRDGTLDNSNNNQLKSWVDGFVNESINAMREKQSEVQKEFQKTFSLDGTISNTEQDVMEYLNGYFEEGVNKENALREEIFKTGNDAIGKHGKELDKAMQTIKEKLAELKAIQLEYSEADSAGEAAYAKSKFQSKAQRVAGIDGASQLLKERAQEYQKAIDEVRANSDKTIAWTQSRIANESDPNKKSKLQAGLKEATDARDKALQEAQKNFESDLKTLYEQYPNAKGKLNEKTGEKFTRKDLQYQDRFSGMQKQFPDMKNITKEGFYGLTDSVTGQLNSLYVTIDSATGKIAGAWNQTNGDIGGYTQSMGDKIKELGNAHMEVAGNASQALARMGASVDVNTNTLRNNFGGVITELSNVSIAADGTRTAIANINGTQIVITSNADGEITSFSELGKTINNTPKSANVTITSNAASATGEVNGYSNSINNVPKSKTTIFTKIIRTVEEFLGIGNKPKEKANGTSFSNGAFSTVDERGWELSDKKSVPILGSYNSNPLTYMNKGTKILNHMQSVQNMKDEVASQVDKKVGSQPQQVEYQLIKPQQQVQMAGFGGVSFGDINVKVEEKQDIDSIIAQATQEFADNLRQALSNIKR